MHSVTQMATTEARGLLCKALRPMARPYVDEVWDWTDLIARWPSSWTQQRELSEA